MRTQVDWSPQQRDFLDKFPAWQKAGNEQFYRLFGYAGAGKTELARAVAEMCGEATGAVGLMSNSAGNPISEEITLT